MGNNIILFIIQFHLLLGTDIFSIRLISLTQVEHYYSSLQKKKHFRHTGISTSGVGFEQRVFAFPRFMAFFTGIIFYEKNKVMIQLRDE